MIAERQSPAALRISAMQMAAWRAGSERSARKLEYQRAERERIRELAAKEAARLASIEVVKSNWRTAQGKVIRIIGACAEHYHVSVADILSQRRTANVIKPRQVSVYLAKSLTPLTLPAIGHRFGRDHSTVLASIQKITALLSSDDNLRADLEAIKDALAG